MARPKWRYFFGCPLPSDAGELEGLADRLAVSMTGTARSFAGRTATDTSIVQERIREAIRFRRDGWLWLLAVLAALASVASACAAWVAALRHS